MCMRLPFYPAAASAVVRKLASFTVSYVYFARPLSPAIILGALLVFTSVGFKAFWNRFGPQWQWCAWDGHADAVTSLSKGLDAEVVCQKDKSDQN